MSNRSIMFRLRRANPLPEAPAEDAADLFAGFEWPEPLPLEWDSVTTRGAGGGRAVLIAMNAWECTGSRSSAAATRRRGSTPGRS
jgi:hypothetical protein